jgi:hypothetical protein
VVTNITITNLENVDIGHVLNHTKRSHKALQSATAAVEAGSMAWDRLALFHNAFGDCARFRDIQAASLSPIKPPSTNSPPQGTEVLHSALPSSSRLRGAYERLTD